MLYEIAECIKEGTHYPTYYWYHEDNGYLEIVECYLFSGRIITEDGDFSEFNWELEESHIYREEFEGNPELIAELDRQLIEFFVFIMERINDKFDLGLDVNSIASSKEAIEIGEAIYKYFILRYTKNITRFITKYIFKNKKTICQYYSDLNGQKKDVSTLAYKKQIKNFNYFI